MRKPRILQPGERTLAAAVNRAEKAYLIGLMTRHTGITSASMEAGVSTATMGRLLTRHGFKKNERWVS